MDFKEARAELEYLIDRFALTGEPDNVDWVLQNHLERCLNAMHAHLDMADQIKGMALEKSLKKARRTTKGGGNGWHGKSKS